MKKFESFIRKMDFDYFGTGQHKISFENFFASENTIFLDVRANEEVENIDIKLANYSTVLSIPTNEIPDRVGEIPEGKLIGVFCSSAVRSVIVFSYLKSLGFSQVKILQGYDELMSELKPGKLYKHFLNKNI